MCPLNIEGDFRLPALRDTVGVIAGAVNAESGLASKGAD